MRTVDLFVVGGSDHSVDDGVVVELYGRTRDGAPLVAHYYGFRPYFEITDPTPEVRERLSKDPEVVRSDEISVWVDGRTHSALRVTIHKPWVVPEYRERYRRAGEDASVLACDIPFVHRFLYDKHLGLCITFEAEEEPAEIRERYTVAEVVRVVPAGERDIRPTDPFRPSLRVLSFDIENAIRERTIFTICGVAEGGGRPRRTFRIGQVAEREILEEFARIVLEDDPDVITG